MEISDSQARIYAIKQLESKKRNEPESRGNLPCDAQTEGAANSRVYGGGNLSREERLGEKFGGFYNSLYKRRFISSWRRDRIAIW